MKTDRVRGFTWIEGLVVLAILLILAAILFPVFARVREPRSRGGRSCSSNLKNIGLGLINYVQDSNETFPKTGFVSATANAGWMETLQPYIKSYDVFGCPNDRDWQPADIDATKSTSYYFNRNLADKSLKQVRWIAHTISFADGDASASDFNCASLTLCYSGGARKNGPGNGQFRHLNSANYAFADGHVKWLKPNQVQPNSVSATTYGFPIR